MWRWWVFSLASAVSFGWNCLNGGFVGDSADVNEEENMDLDHFGVDLMPGKSNPSPGFVVTQTSDEWMGVEMACLLA